MGQGKQKDWPQYSLQVLLNMSTYELRATMLIVLFRAGNEKW